jgi:hypothetical protein
VTLNDVENLLGEVWSLPPWTTDDIFFGGDVSS